MTVPASAPPEGSWEMRAQVSPHHVSGTSSMCREGRGPSHRGPKLSSPQTETRGTPARKRQPANSTATARHKRLRESAEPGVGRN